MQFSPPGRDGVPAQRRGLCRGPRGPGPRRAARRHPDPRPGERRHRPRLPLLRGGLPLRRRHRERADTLDGGVQARRQAQPPTGGTRNGSSVRTFVCSVSVYLLKKKFCIGAQTGVLRVRCWLGKQFEVGGGAKFTTHFFFSLQVHPVVPAPPAAAEDVQGQDRLPVGEAPVRQRLSGRLRVHPMLGDHGGRVRAGLRAQRSLHQAGTESFIFFKKNL